MPRPTLYLVTVLPLPSLNARYMLLSVMSPPSRLSYSICPELIWYDPICYRIFIHLRGLCVL